jgi:hypothetical protein
LGIVWTVCSESIAEGEDLGKEGGQPAEAVISQLAGALAIWCYLKKALGVGGEVDESIVGEKGLDSTIFCNENTVQSPCPLTTTSRRPQCGHEHATGNDKIYMLLLCCL